MRTLTALLFLTLLAACADPVEDAKESVKGAATYPRDLEYREIKVVRKDVVCGEFKQSDRWGESRGFQPFIVLAGDPRLNPTDLDLKVFCSEDPATALQNAEGIGPVKPENASLVKIYTDLSMLATALEAYREDFNKYPSQVTQQGLVALTKPRRGSPDPKDTYIDEVPVDPWGNAYVYRTPRLLHGASDKYELYTLGEEGKIGGEGQNADIGTQHLEYLDHIGGL